MTRLRLAIQKSGRLHDQSVQLLKDCGIDLSNGRDQLKLQVRNFPMEVLYLRNSDIPEYIEKGVADIGIIGENLLVESSARIKLVEKLGFSKCRLSIATPRSSNYESIRDLEGKRIATSYPNSLQDYLDANNISASIHTISGSVEIAPNIGLADAVCDLVSSGSTLFKNGLEEREAILYSEAILAARQDVNSDRQEILDELVFRIQAVQRAQRSKYVLMNVPNDRIYEVSEILPVLKSPTIMPLAEEGWSSLHSVIEESKFWKIISQLKKAGAEDILVIPIDKMIR